MPGVPPLQKTEGASYDTVGLNGIEANLIVGSTCLDTSWGSGQLRLPMA